MNDGNLMMMDESDMPQPQVRITSRLIDSLYTEAMLLADEARSYFDDAAATSGRRWSRSPASASHASRSRSRRASCTSSPGC